MPLCFWSYNGINLTTVKYCFSQSLKLKISLYIKRKLTFLNLTNSKSVALILKVFKKIILLKPFKMSDNITETIQNEWQYYWNHSKWKIFFLSNPPPRHFFPIFRQLPYCCLLHACLSTSLLTFFNGPTHLDHPQTKLYFIWPVMKSNGKRIISWRKEIGPHVNAYLLQLQPPSGYFPYTLH